MRNKTLIILHMKINIVTRNDKHITNIHKAFISLCKFEKIQSDEKFRFRCNCL